MVKVLIKIFLPFFLGSFFALWAFSFASAEEVQLTPSDSISIGYFYQYGYPDQAYITVDTFANIPSVASNRWYNGSECLNTLKTIYNPDSVATSYPFDSSYGQYVTPLLSVGNNKSWQNSNVVWLRDQEISLDITGFLPGYYRYEADIYVGCQFFPAFLSDASSNGFIDLTPSYTYVSEPIENPSGVTTQYYGTVDCINHLSGYYNRGTRSDLIHVGLSWLFYTDGTDTIISTNFEFPFSILTYDFTTVKAVGDSTTWNNFCIFANTRFASRLYSNVEPPITPTPVPTPYPGQDTQESINQGVSNIESQMNQLINSLNPVVSPIPTPADFTIDETLFDELESMTLPDVSAAEDTFSSLWDIFNPLWWLLALLFSVTFVIGIFLYVLRGGFI